MWSYWPKQIIQSVHPFLDLVVGTLGIDWAVILMMNPSHTTMKNCNSLRANSPFKGYQEMSHRRHRSKVKVRAHSNVCFSLEMESMTFLSSRAHSLFSKQILKKILAIYILSNIYFTSTSPFSPISTNPKQFFTLTCAWQKKSPHMWDTIMLKCTLQWRLLLYWTVSALLIFSQFL